jgi:hypothetical protein
MSFEMKKARVKVLKRIINSLSVEINELRMRGETDIEELETARSAIIKFCNRLLPSSRDSVIFRHSHDGPREFHPGASAMKQAA